MPKTGTHRLVVHPLRRDAVFEARCLSTWNCPNDGSRFACATFSSTDLSRSVVWHFDTGWDIGGTCFDDYNDNGLE